MKNQNTSTKAPRRDLYQEITDAIIHELEQGSIPWRKPWIAYIGGKHTSTTTIDTSKVAVSHETGRPYSFLNQLYVRRPGEYITWNQVQKEGGRVKKGAKAKTVVFWKFLKVEELNDEGELVTKTIPYLKGYSVFHIDDCEGIKPKWDKVRSTTTTTTMTGPEGYTHTPSDLAESLLHAYIDREHITFRSTVSDRAYYSPMQDMISVPAMEQFSELSEYYSTVFHEATHSTGHRSRLDRLNGIAAFGDEVYSKEELVAEIGAASILNAIGIETPDSFRNSAAYIQSWLKALKDDKRLIVSAAGKAEKAVEYIFGSSTNDTEADGE